MQLNKIKTNRLDYPIHGVWENNTTIKIYLKMLLGKGRGKQTKISLSERNFTAFYLKYDVC